MLPTISVTNGTMNLVPTKHIKMPKTINIIPMKLSSVFRKPMGNWVGQAQIDLYSIWISQSLKFEGLLSASMTVTGLFFTSGYLQVPDQRSQTPRTFTVKSLVLSALHFYSETNFKLHVPWSTVSSFPSFVRRACPTVNRPFWKDCTQLPFSMRYMIPA